MQARFKRVYNGLESVPRRLTALELHIQAKNMELNDQVRNHASQKLGQLGRQLPGITNAVVELASEPTRSQKDRVVAQVTLDVNGAILRSEQRAANTRAAINSAVDDPLPPNRTLQKPHLPQRAPAPGPAPTSRAGFRKPGCRAVRARR